MFDTCLDWYLLVLPSETHAVASMTSLRPTDGDTSYHSRESFSLVMLPSAAEIILYLLFHPKRVELSFLNFVYFLFFNVIWLYNKCSNPTLQPCLKFDPNEVWSTEKCRPGIGETWWVCRFSQLCCTIERLRYLYSVTYSCTVYVK